jgi:hypothetical protein
VLVHRARLDARDVDPLDEAPVVPGRLAEVHGDVAAAPGVAVAPVEAAEVPVEPEEVRALWIALDDGARAERHAAADLHVAELVAPYGERLVEEIRLAEAEAVVDPIARPDDRRGAVGSDALAGQLGLERHGRGV